MINQISETITQFFLHQESISEEEKDVYKYGVEITVSSLLNVILILLIGLLFDNLLSGAVFLVCFIIVRKYTGGYHAETYFRCNMVLCTTYTIVYISSNNFDINVWSEILILLVDFEMVIKYSPVNNIHKKLDINQKKNFHRLAILFYMLFSIISLILLNICSFYGKLILFTLLSIALMIVVEIILQKRGIHES